MDTPAWLTTFDGASRRNELAWLGQHDTLPPAPELPPDAGAGKILDHRVLLMQLHLQRLFQPHAIDLVFEGTHFIALDRYTANDLRPFNHLPCELYDQPLTPDRLAFIREAAARRLIDDDLDPRVVLGSELDGDAPLMRLPAEHLSSLMHMFAQLPYDLITPSHERYPCGYDNCTGCSGPNAAMRFRRDQLLRQM